MFEWCQLLLNGIRECYVKSDFMKLGSFCTCGNQRNWKVYVERTMWTDTVDKLRRLYMIVSGIIDWRKNSIRDLIYIVCRIEIITGNNHITFFWFVTNLLCVKVQIKLLSRSNEYIVHDHSRHCINMNISQ